jgi:hypothetical protein
VLKRSVTCAERTTVARAATSSTLASGAVLIAVALSGCAPGASTPQPALSSDYRVAAAPSPAVPMPTAFIPTTPSPHTSSVAPQVAQPIQQIFTDRIWPAMLAYAAEPIQGSTGDRALGGVLDPALGAHDWTVLHGVVRKVPTGDSAPLPAVRYFSDGMKFAWASVDALTPGHQAEVLFCYTAIRHWYQDPAHPYTAPGASQATVTLSNVAGEWKLHSFNSPPRAVTHC